jgi:hypothetical protein
MYFVPVTGKPKTRALNLLLVCGRVGYRQLTMFRLTTSNTNESINWPTHFVQLAPQNVTSNGAWEQGGEEVPLRTGSVQTQLLTQSLHVMANSGSHYKQQGSNRNHHATLATDLHDSLR